MPLIIVTLSYIHQLASMSPRNRNVDEAVAETATPNTAAAAPATSRTFEDACLWLNKTHHV